jgi:hypothetical protein
MYVTLACPRIDWKNYWTDLDAVFCILLHMMMARRDFYSYFENRYRSITLIDIDYRFFFKIFKYGHAAHVSRSILGRETRIRCYFCENRSLSIVMIDFGIDYRFSENFEFGHAAHVSRSILGRETRIRCYFCENRSLSIVMIDFGFAGEARNKVYARKTPKIELFPRAFPLKIFFGVHYRA